MYKKLTELMFKKCDDTFIQFIKYCFVGGVATITDFGIFYVLNKRLSMYYLIANMLGFVGGVWVSYVLSCKWVFDSAKNKDSSFNFAVFLIIGIIGLLFNSAIMYILVDYKKFTEFYAKAAATVLVLLWNFFARKKLVFN